jgi:hypothetical protein
VLASIVQATPIILSPVCPGPPEAALAEAAQLGLTGIVAKRAGSFYRPNALATPWVKVLVDSRAPAEGRSRSRGSRSPMPVIELAAAPAGASGAAGSATWGTSGPLAGP